MPTAREDERRHESLLVRNERRTEREVIAFFAALFLLMKEQMDEIGMAGVRAAIENAQPKLEELLKESYMRSGPDGMRLTSQMLPDDDFSEEAVILALFFWASKESVIASRQITNTTIKIFDRLVADDIASSTGDGVNRPGSVQSPKPSAPTPKPSISPSVTPKPKPGTPPSVNPPTITPPTTAAPIGTVKPDLDKVLRELQKRNRKRAGTIASTETGKGVNTGASEAATEIQRGQIFEIRKSWKSKKDFRVRPSHARANNRYTREPIPVNDIFQVGASFGRYPLDVTLSAAESINCRCYVSYRKVKISGN